ncbi:protein DEK-like [Panicum miliaceum]|uniref:Protein DEK-like n=1 Tax=Panicum miliaceum TaxID=4540 RepID=A0A3L6TLV3_PANMI|nr:protein DEK-like [Panicum miliaceum]
MEEKAVANGTAADDVAAPDNKDNANKEEAVKSMEPAVVNKDVEEQNKGSENGTEGLSDGDVKMSEAESAKEGDAAAAKEVDSEDVKMDADAKEGDGDASVAKQVDSEDVKMDADAKEDTDAKKEGEDVKMTEAEEGNAEVKDKEEKEDEVGNANLDKLDESKEREKDGSAEQEESKGKETEEHKQSEGTKQLDAEEEKDDADEKQQEEEAEEKGSADKKDEADNLEENKEETPKNKKVRSARDRSQGKEKKQDGSKSREAKSLLETLSPYGTDRPQRERKTVARLVEVIEKEPNRNFVVEKGRGTPLKDIPNVAHRISRKKPGDLKFLHNLLFGRKGKIVDFKGHILQFSGFVWHESDEKQRAKAKDKLDKCVKDTLLDLCWMLAIPVPKANLRKEDIVSKLLDFIAEPHSAADSGLSDDQGSNSRKRKRGGESASKAPDGTPSRSWKKFGNDSTSGKRRKKALKYDTDEDEDGDESMKSDSEENRDEDAEEQEDDYDSGKEKARKKFPKVKESSSKKKTDTGSGHKTGHPKTISKSPVKKASSKISEEKESPDNSAKVFSRKRKPTAKGEKDIKEKQSAGKKVTKGKGESAGADLPSKDELRKTITAILKKVDFNTATFSDILKKLDNHYKMDLTSKKEAIKVMIQDELTKMSEEADEDEDTNEDTGKKQQQPQAKEVEA